MRALWLMGVACAASCAACANNTTSVQLVDFERPGVMQMVCYDVATDELVKKNLCDVSASDTRRFILVSQISRGEVAAINLNTRKVIDTVPVVPGTTFFEVDEGPSGMVTASWLPNATYVASFSSRAIQLVNTRKFLDLDIDPLMTDVPEAGDRIDLTSSPVDLALWVDNVATPSAAKLFAALPDEGAIAEIDLNLTTGEFMGPATLRTLPGAVGTPDIEQEVLIYHRDFCLADLADPPMRNVVLGVPRIEDQESLGALARPMRLRLDTLASPNVLLVTDAARPIIARFNVSVGGAVATTSIATEVPVLDIAVTPDVRAQVDSATTSLRYLYAIDAISRRVMAINYTSASANFGRLIANRAGLPPLDRIERIENAIALEVVTPGFPDNLCVPSGSDPDPDAATPDNLRGVFLAVSSTNQQIRFVEVEDLDAQCRGGLGCNNPPISSDIIVNIQRHRPRGGSFFDEDFELINRPSLPYDGHSGRLDAEGQPVDVGTAPGFQTIADCATLQMRPVFQNSMDDDLLCVIDDSWLVRGEQWIGTWEGEIPDARGGLGHLAGTDMFMASDAHFCESGVLGSQDVMLSALAATDPELNYAGDELIITSELDALRENDPDCATFKDLEPEVDPVGFQILSAKNQELMLGPNIGADYDFAKVQQCFPDFVEYEVRTRLAYTMIGTLSGFIHRVFADSGASDACRVDKTNKMIVPNQADTYLNSRVLPEEQFISPFLTFELGALPVATQTPLEAQISIELRNPFGTLFVGTHVTNRFSVPGVLHYEPLDSFLYLVDLSSGVSQIDLHPLDLVRTFD